MDDIMIDTQDFQGFFPFFVFFPRGDKMRLYGLLGGKYISVCKACSKLGGSGGMLPRGNFDFGLFIRRNLVESGTVFTHYHLSFIVSS